MASGSDTIGGRDGDTLPENISNEDKRRLAEYTLEGKWELVVEMYSTIPETHTATVKDTLDTALHVAIEFDKEKIVKDLVNAIVDYGQEEEESVLPTKEAEGQEEIKREENRRSRIRKALMMKNERGDTPLHVAAARGFARICKCIVGDDNKNQRRLDLLREKNKQGETPVFVAALNGSKIAFAYLSSILQDQDPVFVTRDLVRDNGDSILHIAIWREFLDLAVIIAHRYPALSICANRDGFTPLKVLAGILVEPVDVERTMEKLLDKINQQPPTLKFPKNYDTMCELWKQSIKFSTLLSSGKLSGEKQYDTEDPPIEGGSLPPNYTTFEQFFRSAYVSAFGIAGVAVSKIKEEKENHTWSIQLLDALMKNPYAAYTGSGGKPEDLPVDPGVLGSLVEQLGEEGTSSTTGPDTDSTKQSLTTSEKNGEKESTPIEKGSSEVTNPNPAKDTNDPKETPLLLAARNGIYELVTRILEKLPSTLHDTNSNKENVLLVAVLNRQPKVVETLKKKLREKERGVWDNLILAEDVSANTVLHLAAIAQDPEKHKQVAGAALQMMWDTKWFEYINSIVPEHFCFRVNNEKKTARDIFKKTHGELVKDSCEWLKDTSESCSVVAALVAGVSFATATTVPGGNGENGHPPLQGKPAFDAFAISSLVGLCFSATGLIMFLTILTSRKEARDFRRGLPKKLLLGLSSLFVSIAALFVTFYSGHFFNVKHKYEDILVPVYAATSLPMAFYALAQFPLYFDLLFAIFRKVPRARDKGGRL